LLRGVKKAFFAVSTSSAAKVPPCPTPRTIPVRSAPTHQTPTISGLSLPPSVGGNNKIRRQNIRNKNAILLHL
jgi:hypothetical protein